MGVLHSTHYISCVPVLVYKFDTEDDVINIFLLSQNSMLSKSLGNSKIIKLRKFHQSKLIIMK